MRQVSSKLELKFYSLIIFTVGYEWLPSTDTFHCIAHTVCDDDHPESQAICVDIFENFLGVSKEKLNASMLTFYLDHLPAGSNTQTSDHYAQLGDLYNGNFVRYVHDYDPTDIPDPIPYEVEKITTYTSFYIGAEDGTSVEDTGTLTQKMQNTASYVIAGYDFSHVDFFAHMDAGKLVYQPIIEEMNQIRSAKSTTQKPPATTSDSMSSSVVSIPVVLLTLLMTFCTWKLR